MPSINWDAINQIAGSQKYQKKERKAKPQKPVDLPPDDVLKEMAFQSKNLRRRERRIRELRREYREAHPGFGEWMDLIADESASGEVFLDAWGMLNVDAIEEARSLQLHLLPEDVRWEAYCLFSEWLYDLEKLEPWPWLDNWGAPLPPGKIDERLTLKKYLDGG